MEPASCYLFKSGIAIKPILFIVLTLLLASPAVAEKPLDYSDVFADAITPILFEVLQSHHETQCFFKDKMGVWCRLVITPRYLRQIAKDAYIASQFNPSWGNRELTAIKHLSVAFAESRFNYGCVFLNKNKTWDSGIEQVNEVNWCTSGGVSCWKKFCKKLHLDSKNKNLIFDPLVNMEYGAYLNEHFIQSDQATYIYDGKPHQHKIYQAMIDSLN